MPPFSAIPNIFGSAVELVNRKREKINSRKHPKTQWKKFATIQNLRRHWQWYRTNRSICSSFFFSSDSEPTIFVVNFRFIIHFFLYAGQCRIYLLVTLECTTTNSSIKCFAMWSFIYSDCWTFALFNFIIILYSKRRLIWLKTIKRWDYWRMSRRLDSTTDPSLCLRRSPFERQMVLRAAAQHRTIFFFTCVCLCVACEQRTQWASTAYVVTERELRME